MPGDDVSRRAGRSSNGVSVGVSNVNAAVTV